MSKYIVILEDDDNNNDTSVIMQDSLIVIHGYRKDINNFSSIKEMSYPGIYILIGDDKKVYVGQASKSMLSRIKNHDKYKDWWTQVVMISKKTKDLTKNQLDYMEKNLIKKFSNNSSNVLNGNMGNNSYMENYQIIECDSLISKANNLIISFSILEESKNVHCHKGNGSQPLLHKKSTMINKVKTVDTSLVPEIVEFLVSENEIEKINGYSQEILEYITNEANIRDVDTRYWGNTGRWFANIMKNNYDYLNLYFNITEQKKRKGKYYYFNRR